MDVELTSTEMNSAFCCTKSYRSVSIETKRLILAPPTVNDFDDMYLMWSDRHVVAKVIDSPLTKEEVWARLHRIVGHWALLGYGHWTVRERCSKKFVGEIGFFDFKRGLSSGFGKVPEIGWMLTTESQGLGYATEAATAALEWLETDSLCKETVCIITPDNLASLALARRLSYKIKEEITYRGKAMLVLQRDAAPIL